jgi:hypothetical protein
VLRSFLIEAIYRKALACHVEVAKDMGSDKSGNTMSVETEIVERMKSMSASSSSPCSVFTGSTSRLVRPSSRRSWA